MKTTDYLLLSHIDYTTSGAGPDRRRASTLPSILRSIAIIILACSLLIVFATAQLADFVDYVKKNEGGQGFITANEAELESTVFFNLGNVDEPGHADWRARLHMEKTPAFAAITGANGRAFTQRDIIDFVEDWAHLFRGWRDGGGGESPEIRISTVVSSLRKIKIAERSEAETRQDQFKA